MNDEELKKTAAKKLARLRAHNDGLWTHVRKIAPKLTALANKSEPFSNEDMKLFRICLGIVLSETLVNETEVLASELLTPDEEDKYGGTNP
jgi:hypothetical protein